MIPFNINLVRMGALVETKFHTEITIITTNAPGSYPVIGYSIQNNGEIHLEKWTIEGKTFCKNGESSNSDLQMKEISGDNDSLYAVFRNTTPIVFGSFSAAEEYAKQCRSSIIVPSYKLLKYEKE